MFFPSGRNTAEALNAMFDEAEVHIILTADAPTPVVSSIIADRGMQHMCVPSQDDILDPDPVDDWPFEKTFDALRSAPWVRLHTSGSTGVPKVVTLKHGFASAIDGFQTLSPNPMSHYAGLRMLIPFPPFHLAGINHSLTSVVWADATAVLPPPGVPITSDVVHEMHVYAHVEYSMLAPSLLSDLVKSEAGLQTLRQLHGVSFSGGPLSETTAHIASEYTKLHSTIGATEFGGVPQLPKDPEDFNYFRFNEAIGGIDFRETDIEGYFEMVFYRHPPIDFMQAIFVTFPHLDEYHTKDCFSKHPTKPGLWKYEYRIDDIIVLSNGEMFNPLPMEGAVAACPDLTGCLVFGQGRFHSGLLAELKEPDTPRAQLITSLELYVEEANRLCPDYARLSLEHIIFALPEKPLPRAPKGTIQRSKANHLYQSEISRMYESVDSGKGATDTLIDFASPITIERSVLDWVSSQAGGIPSLQSTDDFFAVGMDSLQVIALARLINKSRPLSAPSISPALIYQSPTAKALAGALAAGVRVMEYSDFDDDDDFDKETWQSMEDVFQGLKSGDDDRSPSLRAALMGLLRPSTPPPLYQPDGGKTAWLQVLGSFLVNMNNWGLVNSFGVFQIHYQADLLHSHSPSAIAWIGTVQGALLLLVGSLSGPLFDKGFFGSLLVLAGVGVVLGLMLLSLATQYYQIMLAQGILVGICLGLLYIPSVALIPLYFKSYRSLALGMATAGGSFGGVIYPLIFRSLLARLGFEWALRIMGFVALVALVAAFCIIKPVGARTTRQLLDWSAFAESAYVAYLVSGLLLFAGVLVPFLLASTYANDVLGQDIDVSLSMPSILNAAQFFGRILPAIITDWVGPEILLGVGTVTAALLGFAWIAVGDVAGYIVWLVFYGLASGMVVTLPAIVLPYISPSMATIGTRLGMVYGVAGVGFLISSPVALALNGVTTRFLGSQLWVAACSSAALIFYSVTFREARKRRRLYENNERHQKSYLLRRSRSHHISPGNGPLNGKSGSSEKA